MSPIKFPLTLPILCVVICAVPSEASKAGDRYIATSTNGEVSSFDVSDTELFWEYDPSVAAAVFDFRDRPNPTPGFRYFQSQSDPTLWIAWPDDLTTNTFYLYDEINGSQKFEGTIELENGYPAPSPPPTQTVVQIEPNAPLPPVSIRLTNSHRHPIYVSIVDRKPARRRPTELKIVSGGTIHHTIQRDSGAIRRKIEVTDTGGVVRILSEEPIDPISLYDVVVYEYKTVSMYIDRTGKDKMAIPFFLPPSSRKGLRSIGVLRLPAGEELVEDSSVDAYHEARRQNNPGAAARYERPRVHR